MPTSWSAGDHDCTVVLDSGTATLECKCGWTRALAKDEVWSVDEPWREIAREHVQSYPPRDSAPHDR